MNSKRFWLGPAAAALTLVAPVCRAEPGDPLTDRFSLSLGGFMLGTETELRIDGSTENTGTDIDLERDLGFDDIDRFRIDGYWRFKPRHKIRLMYFDTNRSNTIQIDREIEVGDTIYPIDTEVEAQFETSVAELAYEYAFVQRKTYEIAATAGLHNLRFDFSLSGEAGTLNESAEANGPLPVIGLRGIWRFSERFYADGQIQFFEVSLDPYDGRIEDYNVSLVWQAFSRVGFGVGYNAFVTRVDVDGDRFNGRMSWKYDGARIYAVASF